MTLIALCSAKGSPGVTVTGLAMLLTARQPTILAELDPAGGDLLGGFLEGRQTPDRGLAKLAVAEHRDRLLDEFWSQMLDLDPEQSGTRLALPGVNDPAQAASLEPTWDRIASVFIGLSAQTSPFDVIADCGRIPAPYAPWPVLRRADHLLMVVRPTAVSLRAASIRLNALRADFAQRGQPADSLGLIVTGDGPEKSREIADALAVPVLATIPHDPATAAVLSHGGRYNRRSPLMRAGNTAADQLTRVRQARRALFGRPGRVRAHA
jgi:hypothetical protein